MSQNDQPIVRKPSRKVSVTIALVFAVLLTVFASILTANIAHVSDAINNATVSVMTVLFGGMDDAGRGIINTLTIPVLVLLCCGISCALAWYILRVANVEKRYAMLLSLVPVAAPVVLSFLTGGFGMATWLALLGGVVCVFGMVLYDHLTKRFPRFFNSEVISYIFFGALTTVISYVVFMIFVSYGWTEEWANIPSWICAVLFAYVVNKIFVFKSQTHGFAEFKREAALFFGARLVSLVVEEIFIIITCTWMQLPAAPCKLFAQIIVLIANYVFSKLVIFRNKGELKKTDKDPKQLPVKKD
ncbi:MAG: GtrA family protein [Clostridia bacterium]|nr:GtrA family protein [Clostridia bacterium]